MDIFISYANADRGAASRLADALTGRGYAVWWDRTIPPGRVFDEVIQEAIHSARCMVVLWSPDSVRSNWVKTEAAEGVTRGILVPVLLGEVMPPIEFKRIHAANLSRWDGDESNAEYRGLLAAIERLMKRETGSQTVVPQAVTVPAILPSGKLKTFMMGAGFALAIVGAVWLYQKFSQDAVSAPPLANTVEPAVSSTGTDRPPPISVSASSSSAVSDSTQPRGRINLLSADHGGQLLAAATDKWHLLVDGKDETYAWTDNGFGVFGFRDGRPALIDTFTILIPAQDNGNLKEFELLVGNSSPTGPFESLGRFNTQNLRMIQNPYQEFHFTPVTATYFKLQSLRSHGGAEAAFAYEIQLFGELQ